MPLVSPQPPGKEAPAQPASPQTHNDAHNVAPQIHDVAPSDLSTKTPKKVSKPSKSLHLPSKRLEKKQAFITRTIWSVVMIVGFLVLIVLGHLPIILFVILCQILIFKEIISLTAEPARDKNLPFNKALNWYFLITTVYYLDGESIFAFLTGIYANDVLIFWYKNHKLVAYTMYLAGFIFFVWTLKKGFYKFQFAQLCVTHMTLLVVVFQSHLIIDNIFNGIIWLILPCSLVIVNDIFAYLCGITFGRTQLIAISPKKTVEGFVGAWVCTSIAAVLISDFFSKSAYAICPATNLSTTLWNYPHCEPNPVFILQLYQLPDNVAELVGTKVLFIKPLYLHAAVLATFASLIAPFGGFFASGLKRAFGIKDFGDTIPGHGGMTDRFDCQFLMGSFSYLYYQTFIASSNINLSSVLQMAVFHLSDDQILQLIKALLKYLDNNGSLEQNQMETIYELLP